MTTTDALLQADADARIQALEPISIVVEAPAGAGKTELLTQRTLGLLALVDHPEEVVALTFTNKAATEMRDRILGSLELAASGQRPGDDAPHRQLTFDLGRRALARDAERGWNILRHPGRLVVTTIDALCGSLARQMPYLSRFGAQPGVAEDAEPHYRDAARRTLAMVEDGDANAEVVAAALTFVDNDTGRLEALLVSMLASREQWQHYTGRHGDTTGAEERQADAEAGLAALIEQDLAAAARALPGRVQALLMAPARFAAANLAVDKPDAAILPLEQWTAPLAGRLEDLPLWRALAELLLTSSGTLRKRLDKNIGFPASAKEEKEAFLTTLGEVGAAGEAALARLRNLPDPFFESADWATVETFSRLLNLASAQLWLVFQEAGEVDFGEIAQRAILALGSDNAPTDLALALDYRIRHLLVDEFQDTSPAQVRLIAGLTRGWQGNDGDDGRSLFLVGDPMQSIYRFRKADVGLFLKVRDEGIGAIRPRRLRLYRNNRSRPAVVEWVNDHFPAIFPAEDDPLYGAVRYAESSPTKAADPTAGVFVHPVLTGEADEDGAEAEGRVLADLIRQARRERPEETVAVLVRARKHLDALVAELRRNHPDLPFQAVETESLAGRQSIMDLLILAHALGHRGDRVHWLALLRAPWCGLTLADLHALAGDDHQATLWQLMQDDARLARLSADGRYRLERVRTILAEAFAEEGRRHPRRWIEGTWHLLGGPATLADASEQAAAQALFQLMDKLVAQGRFDPETLQAETEALFAPADPGQEAARLQFMTIHKSKGLEFDTVLLPGLHKGGGNDDTRLLLWDEIPGDGPEPHLVIAPMNRRGAANAAPSAYDALRRLEAERAGHESERLLYVAVTRARRALHLVGVVRSDDEGNVKAPRTGTLLDLLWHADVCAAFAEAGAQWVAARKAEGDGAPASATAPLAPAAFVPDLVRLPTPALPALAPPPENTVSHSTAPTEQSGAQADAAVGTLAHRCLELMARDGSEAWPATRLHGLVKPYAHWLRAQGLDQTTAEQGAQRVVAVLCRVAASETGRWVLAPRPQGGAELALSSTGDEAISYHVVDRTFIEDGVRWIIDYKTVRCDAADPAAFLRAKAEGYRPQLERYAALFAGEGLPLRTAIFFVEQGELLELPR